MLISAAVVAVVAVVAGAQGIIIDGSCLRIGGAQERLANRTLQLIQFANLAKSTPMACQMPCVRLFPSAVTPSGAETTIFYSEAAVAAAAAAVGHNASDVECACLLMESPDALRASSAPDSSCYSSVGSGISTADDTFVGFWFTAVVAPTGLGISPQQPSTSAGSNGAGAGSLPTGPNPGVGGNPPFPMSTSPPSDENVGSPVTVPPPQRTNDPGSIAPSLGPKSSAPGVNQAPAAPAGTSGKQPLAPDSGSSGAGGSHPSSPSSSASAPSNSLAKLAPIIAGAASVAVVLLSIVGAVVFRNRYRAARLAASSKADSSGSDDAQKKRPGTTSGESADEESSGDDTSSLGSDDRPAANDAGSKVGLTTRSTSSAAAIV